MTIKPNYLPLAILAAALGCDGGEDHRTSPLGEGVVDVQIPEGTPVPEAVAPENSQPALPGDTGTPNANRGEVEDDRADADVSVDLNRQRSLGNTPSQLDAADAQTPAERRQQRRERIGEALDRVEVDVDANRTDVDVD